jgi:hypothetical protein
MKMQTDVPAELTHLSEGRVEDSIRHSFLRPSNPVVILRPITFSFCRCGGVSSQIHFSSAHLCRLCRLSTHQRSTVIMLSTTRTLRFSAQRVFARSLVSTSGPIPVDVEHYVSGWAIEDIGDYTKPGFFNVHTYNKISPKVSNSFCYFSLGIELLNLLTCPNFHQSLGSWCIST